MSTEEPPPEVPSQPRRRGFRTGRLEAFSDGVFAIAITLLVLDIGVSSNAGQDLLHAIGSLWPSYLAYVASFSTIGAAWLAHNAITEYLDRADAAFVRGPRAPGAAGHRRPVSGSPRSTMKPGSTT